jgi:DNA-binding SARP family transcriptional activator
MIELRTLGALDLRGPDDADCGMVLNQPKRLGLLAYLAIASPRRFHRRDALLALFWPDLDSERARAALRRSLYFLRRALGADCIVGRGEEEVGLAETAVWCDAAAFDAAIAAGRLDEALDLYRGELLEGFYVSGAPDYERWLERERARLRERASRAAWTLAERAEAAGQAEAAGDWARRAAALEPEDEGAVRKLLALLDRIGDRAGALRAYDELTRRLSAEYELEPSAETRALADAIRTRPVAPTPPARRAEAPAGPVSADVLAVFPFTVRADARFAYLGEGMVDLLSTTLDGAGQLRTVDPRALLALVGREEWREIGQAEGAEGAARFGAGLYLLGSIVEAGGRLQVGATLYDAAGSVRARAQAQGESEAQLFEIVDDIARQLLGGVTTGSGARLTRLAALMTESLPALRAYLKGESDLRSGRYFDAMTACCSTPSAPGSGAT